MNSSRLAITSVILLALIHFSGCSGEAEDCQTMTPSDTAPACQSRQITACCSGDHCYYLMDDTPFLCDGLECDNAVRQMELACTNTEDSP